ncbi:hypothetical protein DKX38_001922 [Salix brachista]|uniref:Uncharacterized protein n=1 Tax=Salix brachista TaxID=2182728 RepID=A0A5N5NLQ4_9ROSI|nr:hypothetical protein DKX38_001922 [Salix brachista]
MRAWHVGAAFWRASAEEYMIGLFVFIYPFPTGRGSRPERGASLEKDVFDALMLVKNLGPDVLELGRKAESIQLHWYWALYLLTIRNLLREVECELMDASIHAIKDGDWSRGFLVWRKRLFGDDNEKSEKSDVRAYFSCLNHGPAVYNYGAVASTFKIGFLDCSVPNLQHFRQSKGSRDPHKCLASLE